MVQNNFITKIDDFDKKIMQLRAMGYEQREIALQLGVSQSAISQRIQKIRRETNNIESGDIEKAFWSILLGVGAAYLLNEIFNKR